MQVCEKNTSGGFMMYGDHCIKGYCHTQETVVLCLGKTEFCEIGRAATTVLPPKRLLHEMGVDVEVNVNTESRAAYSSESRR